MPDAMKTVTVAIPCGDSEAYIAESIESVLAQTYRNLEIFVLDERSTDRTLEIARGFRDPRLTVRQNPERLGIGANWNQAFRLGIGPYVVIHHQDDVMTPDAVERKVAFMEANPSAGMVFSRAEVIDERGAMLPRQGQWFSNELLDRDRLFDSMPFFLTLLLRKNMICCPSVLFRREAALAAGGFDEEMEFTLDWEMWLRMAAARPVGYVDRATVRYRVHGDMESRRHFARLGRHYHEARVRAVERSARILGEWPTDRVLAEMAGIIRQVEERAETPLGLDTVRPPAGGVTGLPARIAEIVAGLTDPRDRVVALCREIEHLDLECAALRKAVGEYERSASFRLGRALLAPMRRLKAVVRPARGRGRPDPAR
ncbi:MAG: glycosyltransferase [bacterium]|nr:glycosyltransferase [bacterium]